VRAVALTTVFALTSLVGGGRALAEKKTTEPKSSVVVSELPAQESPGFAWDLGGISELAAGSPVARRFKRDRAHRRVLPKKVRADLSVCIDTQTGAFDPLIADAARTWAIDPFLLKGLLYNESKLDPKLTGKRLYRRVRGKKVAVGGGARGIAQFTTSGISAVNEVREKRYRTGDRVRPLAKDDVWDPELAIPAAAELLASYMDRFGRDGGVTAYNSGPYGGRLVAKHGFYRARHTGKLSKVGRKVIQGHRFLLNVLYRTNQFRKQSGLERLHRPRDRRTRTEKGLDRLIRQRRQRRKPNS